MAVVDSKGNPVRDSKGNPVRSGNAVASSTNPRLNANLASQGRNSQLPAASMDNLVGSALKWGENALGSVAGVGKDIALNFADNLGIGSLIRGKNLPTNGMPGLSNFKDGSWGSGGDQDWRVRLSLPRNFAFQDSALLQKLIDTNGLVFPYTPTILMQHNANYNALEPVHSNYPFYAYRNSRVEQMTLVGDFYVENADEGLYWIAAVHYLRSVTKMSYGQTSDRGAPPPVVKLNGYGDYVFKNVPVVVTNFTVELSPDVDYIHIPGIGPNGTYCPTRSQIQVGVLPVYSRRSVEGFSLDSFVRGATQGGPDGPGFL